MSRAAGSCVIRTTAAALLPAAGVTSGAAVEDARQTTVREATMRAYRQPGHNVPRWSADGAESGSVSEPKAPRACNARTMAVIEAPIDGVRQHLQAMAGARASAYLASSERATFSRMAEGLTIC